MAAAAAPGARRVFQLRGHRQPAALKDQRYRAALVLLAPNPRARGALGDQTDPLEPAGRRFANFVLAIFFGANDGARAFGVNAGGGRRGAGRAQGFSATGSSPTRGIERSAVSRSVGLTGAESSCARRAGRSDRPARAGWAALRQFRFSDILWGERWSSGVRGERWLAAAAAPGARRVFQLRGHRQPAALKDQRYRAALVLLAPNPRARGALGDQTDPLEPAGRRFANFVFAIFFGGERWSSGVRGERWWRPPRRRARAGR